MTQILSKLITASALTLAAFSLAAVTAPAQDGQSEYNWTAKPDAHANHDHSAHAHQTPINMGVENVFTEAENDHVIGAATAGHTLIVYASVVCGHCGRWFQDDYPIIKERLIDTGKLRLVFREFPTQPADVAFMGFQIANCAAPEDYFDAIVYQFQTQEETFDRLGKGEGRARFLEIADKAGVKTENDMLACFQDEAGKARVETSMKRAQAGKIEAVPALILDGALMPGLNGAREVLAALGEPIGK